MEPKRNRFVTNAFWSVFGTFLVRAINLVSIPIFSRILNSAEYGDANIFLTYVSIFTIIVCLDSYGTFGKGVISFKDDIPGFLSVGLSYTTGISLCMLAAFNIFADPLGRLMAMSRSELNALIIYSHAMAIVAFVSQYYLFNFRYKANAALSLTAGLTNLLLSILFILTVFKSDRVSGRIWGATLPTVIMAIILIVYYLRKGKKIVNAAYIKHYLKGIPLIPHNLSHFILGNSDKIMIKSMIGSAENGVYSLVYNVGLMAAVLIEAFNNVWNPWMFRKMDEGDTKVLKKAYVLYALGFSAVIMAVEAVTPEVIKVFAPQEYWEGNRFVLWIVFSTYLIFIYQLYVNIEFYELRTEMISVGTVIAAAVNVVLNVLFLKKNGYGFAAVSTIIAYFALYIFHMLICTYVLDRHIINNLKIGVMVLITFLVTVGLQMAIDMWILRWIFALILGAFILIAGYGFYNNMIRQDAVKGTDKDIKGDK
ncbi:MAG: oligosaccharide flippase family protein [Lachnospiraceae bacterium]|nr:oligosaccharide flippase family protein [Lachnospiraceae bacterium]